MEALLVLEDGFCLKGKVFADQGEVFGKVVCNTAMVGYQEIITDPTYHGQILSFTSPHLGNYGCHPNSNESEVPQIKAVLCKSCFKQPRHTKSRQSLDVFLAKHGVIGLEEIDTRSLMLHLRHSGTKRAIVSTLAADADELMEKFDHFSTAAPTNPLKNKDVAATRPYHWDNIHRRPIYIDHDDIERVRGIEGKCHVVVIDLGVKRSVLTALAQRECRITVIPADTDREMIRALNPDGLLLSNGPGDPSRQKNIAANIGPLLGWRPVAGIGLGHQIMGISIGINTFEMPFGHRGVNQPVKELLTGRVLITDQNHGYNLSSETPLPEGTAITHLNLNDLTPEGIENKKYRFFSVQFHPQGYNETHDQTNFYDKFVEMCADAKA